MPPFFTDTPKEAASCSFQYVTPSHPQTIGPLSGMFAGFFVQTPFAAQLVSLQYSPCRQSVGSFALHPRMPESKPLSTPLSTPLSATPESPAPDDPPEDPPDDEVAPLDPPDDVVPLDDPVVPLDDAAPLEDVASPDEPKSPLSLDPPQATTTKPATAVTEVSIQARVIR